MEEALKFLVLIILLCKVSAETYTVKIGTESHINVIDPKFLSFTIDPKYLFLSDDKLNSKECSCMAAALAPAFIRIAGPSTEHMSLRNSTITLHDLDSDAAQDENRLSVSHSQWQRFAAWSNQTGFDLVFALNHQEKMPSGMWDPNTAISILTVAEKNEIEDIYWQLGYECKNQSIEEYLTDLQTLKVIVDTFPSPHWKVVGGDIAPCLQEHSKSDFKDYVMLSNEMLDAILLDGNSSSHELERMSPLSRNRLLSTLATSTTPLWITDSTPPAASSELLRAAQWMYSLGHAARNGFAVHFRELVEDELFQPTLSFYMALLFKNLVGERVLSADFIVPSERTSLFAHCTSLRHKQVPGAVTLFGANLDDEPARFSLKLSKNENGGDVMQFILGLDGSGNIIVNGRAMFHEGDIKPVVRRVRPYKTLLINLPPKSFGFWVLANTNTKACQPEDNEKEIDDKSRPKRSAEIGLDDVSNGVLTNEYLLNSVENINNSLKNVKLRRHERVTENDVYDLKRDKRQTKEEKKSLKDLLTPKRPQTKPKEDKKGKEPIAEKKSGPSIASRLAELNSRLNATRQLRKERAQKLLTRNKVTKRNSIKLPELRSKIQLPELISTKTSVAKAVTEDEKEEPEHSRRKRSILSKKKKFDADIQEILPEKEIEIDTKDLKFGKILRKINEQLNEITDDVKNLSEEKILSKEDKASIEEQLTLRTKISGDDASIKISEKSSSGIFKSALSKIFTLFEEFTEKFDNMLNAADLP